MAIEHQQAITVEEYFQLEENDDEIPLNSLGVQFALSEAYEDVEFDVLTEEM